MHAQDALPIDSTSDKSFWHGYTSFYEPRLPASISGLVLEFGVFKGNSIRWLLARYPQATIVGADILPTQPEWPADARVSYRDVDQGSEEAVARLLAELPAPQLLIEDGSHQPSHQSRCLRLGLRALAPGGTYILEDIHTSHPAHAQFQEEFKADGLAAAWRRSRGARHSPAAQTSLSVLLAFEHLKRRGVGRIPAPALEALTAGNHFQAADIEAMYADIDTIEVFKRATLPDACWRCGSSNYDYLRWRCSCGTALLAEADSMTVLIRKHGASAGV